MLDIIFDGVLTANLLMGISRYKVDDVINCLVNKQFVKQVYYKKKIGKSTIFIQAIKTI